VRAWLWCVLGGHVISAWVCAHSMKNCGTTVQRALGMVEGVTSAIVDYPSRTATVVCSAAVPVEDLIDAVEMVGYDATLAPTPVVEATPPPSVALRVSGMSCMKNCGSKVVRALEGVAGVTSVTMDFPARVVTVNGDAQVVALLAAVRSVGFDATATPTTTTTDALAAVPTLATSSSATGASVSFSSAAAALPTSATVTTRLVVPGMSCKKNCGAKVVAALRAVPGVTLADLRWSDKAVDVTGSAPAAELVEAVRLAGFDARQDGHDGSQPLAPSASRNAMHIRIDGMSW